MDENELYLLEESLWKAKTRFDKVYMKNILDSKFREFGRSGRQYSRDEILSFNRSQQVGIDAIFPLRDFKVQELSREVFLVTYISEVTFDSKLELGNRASIWKKSKTGWKLMFHQGTLFVE